MLLQNNMSGSTFAGKSTADTIRNYAEMLIDDLNSNFPERAGEHWDKAREIDNKTAKQIFGQEYSDRIGEAYYNCITQYQIAELKKLYVALHHFTDNVMIPGASTGDMGIILRDMETLKQHDKKVTEKFDFIMGLLAIGLSICPQSADLNSAAAWVCITRMAVGTVPVGNINLPRNEWKEEGNINEKVYEEIKPRTVNFINAALEKQPGHPEALKAKEAVVLLEKIAAEVPEEEAKSNSCFIATAAYGTPFAKEIDVLRNWRDEVLETSYSGRLFIKTYYTLSPPVAGNISGSSVKRKAVRTVLGPIVKILKNNYSN